VLKFTKPTFEGGKRTKRDRHPSEISGRTGHAARVYDSSRTEVDSRRRDAGKVTIEIVTHFTFNLNVRMNIDTCSRAHADIVDIRSCAAQIEIVGEDSNFYVVALGEQGRATYPYCYPELTGL